MVTIEKCKDVLKHSTQKYTEDEIKRIRELLYKLAEIENDNFKIEQHGPSSDVHKSID